MNIVREFESFLVSEFYVSYHVIIYSKSNKSYQGPTKPYLKLIKYCIVPSNNIVIIYTITLSTSKFLLECRNNKKLRVADREKKVG